jgi:PAS domain S-box-containing protein
MTRAHQFRLQFAPCYRRVIIVALLLAPWAWQAGAAGMTAGGTIEPGSPPEIVFGADREYPPFEYAGTDGRPNGFNIELIRAVIAELGGTVEVRTDNWAHIRRAVETEHTVDVVAMYRTPTRTVALEFSDPFALVYFEIVVRRDTPPINSLADLRGRTVVVQDAAFVQEQLLRLDTGATLVPAVSDPEALRWVAAGMYDCAIVERLAGRYSIREGKLDNLVSSGVPILPVEYCFAVAPGREKLLAQLNQGLAALRASGRHDRLQEKWFGELLRQPTTFRDVMRFAFWILGPLAALAIAATIWSLVLRRVVARRTAELQAELAARTRAEAQLREQFSLLKAITEGTTDAIFIKDRGGRYRMINPAGAHLLGQTPDAILGHDDTAVFTPDSANAIMQSDRQVMDSGQVLTAEECATAAGITRTYHVTKAPWRDDRGTIIGIIGVSRDITDRQQTEEKLRELAEIQRIVLNTLSTGIAYLKNRQHQWVNPAFARIFGYDADTVKGMNAAQFYADAEDYRRVGNEGYAELATGKTYTTEAQMKRRDGSIIWCQITGHAIDPGNLALGSIWALQDISERRQAEAALKESETAFRSLFEASPAATCVLVDRRIRRANILMTKLTGYSAEELIGQSTRIIYHDDDTFDSVGRTLYSKMAQDGVAVIETRLQCKNGRLVDVLIGVSPLDPHDPTKGIAATVVDLTERKAAEDSIRRLNTELEQRVQERTAELAKRTAELERLNADLRISQDDLAHAAAHLQEANSNLLAANQELESFSYSVSHDLRAPLRNIAGFIELLRKRTIGQLDPEADRYFGIIGSEAVRMAALIDDLLTFSRIGRAELHFAPVQLATLVAEVQAELQSDLTGRQIDWRIQPLPPVLGDRTLLRQVIANLLSNAVKFTRKQPQAIIEIGTQPAATGSELIVFYVRDNGAGFDPKYASKLFGVFQRLHNPRDFEGTGIGLANVRRIVERHGGRVWANGSPGQGATFFFSIKPSAS